MQSFIGSSPSLFFYKPFSSLIMIWFQTFNRPADLALFSASSLQVSSRAKSTRRAANWIELKPNDDLCSRLILHNRDGARKPARLNIGMVKVMSSALPRARLPITTRSSARWLPANFALSRCSAVVPMVSYNWLILLTRMCLWLVSTNADSLNL